MSLFKHVLHALQQDNAYLLPLRLFIGLGWLRAGLEKALSTTWYTGQDLQAFFAARLDSGEVVFLGYQRLIESFFEPQAVFIAWLVMLSQFLIAFCIMLGIFSNAALLIGIFLNVNFILAGVINPSAFYIVIQTMLITSNGGVVLGLDKWLSHRVGSRLFVAQACQKTYSVFDSHLMFVFAGLSLAFGLAMLPSIHELGPHSVENPAMILLVLSLFSTLSYFIAFLRLRSVVEPKTSVSTIPIFETAGD